MTEVAYVQLSGASSRATLGLYAGISPQELQQLVSAALNHRSGVCAGFQVASESSNRSGRKKRSSAAVQRIVPLSVACQSPELLSGRVSALFSPPTTSQSVLQPEKESVEVSSDVERLQRLLQALQSEQKLSNFETAVLRDLCEQQRTRVLAVMAGDTSVKQKKSFLLQMLRPDGSEELKKELQTPKRRMKKEQGEDSLHAELVAKKVAAIGTRVFSPQVQMQVHVLVKDIRENWTGKSGDNRFRDTMELLTLVERLLDKHVLPEEHGAHLLELVLGRNQVLWSALQSYKNDGGTLSDLETTAKRLAALGIDPPKPIGSRKNRGKSPRKLAKQSSPAKKRVRNSAAAVPSAVSVVRSLHAQHMLTSLELDIVQALVAQDDTQVLQILRDFEQSDHRDVSVLRDALVGIVEEITMELGDEEKAAVAFARGMDDAVREDNPFMDSDDDSDSLGWQKHLSFLLQQWQVQHHLSPADANTLRKMVVQRHNLLESAYEVFAGDGDASELLDTLQRVAKLQRQIEQSQAGQNVHNGESVSDLGLEDVVREMQRRGVLQGGDAAGLLVLFHGGNEALFAANEAFQADGDVHELEETLLLVVKHARFGGETQENKPIDVSQAVSRLMAEFGRSGRLELWQIQQTQENKPIDVSQAVSRLMAEFGRSGRLELWQIQLLMSLLKSNDPRLLAAVDVYNEDKNVEELLDTLEILVELAAWERHRRAMVHDWIAPLAKTGKLPRGGAECLIQLVKARDDRVVAALVVFLSDNNREEFVDTLARIACLEAMKLKNVQADSQSDESKEGHLVLDLLKELEDKGVMSSQERELIEELVCSGDPRILAAMDVLAATHDAEDFADTARRILVKLAESAEEEEKEGVKAEPEAAENNPNAMSENVECDEEALHDTTKNGESTILEDSSEVSSPKAADQADKVSDELEKPLAPEDIEHVDVAENEEDQENGDINAVGDADASDANGEDDTNV
ncbi:LOW QUALITY PROTEIN: hypothetical protein PHMEG_00030365, partial [Phytophthora megakarya]